MPDGKSYRVTKQELESIANVIRQEGGTSSKLVFPQEFILAIDALPNCELDHIKITKPPSKVDYAVGDEIDYSGIEVTMYKSDGTVYVDSEHMDGKLNISELYFPVQYAPEPEE